MDYIDRYVEVVPDFEAFRESILRPLPITVRINTLKATVEGVMKRFDRVEVGYSQFDWYPDGLRLGDVRPGLLVEHVMGLIHPQEEISMVPSMIMEPKPGEVVLDLCASPGSKTTQVSQMMENRGLLVANEPSSSRIVPLRANCDRMGAMNVVVTKYDGRAFPSYEFDRVLVDAPCSGEGMVRKDLSVLKRCSLKRSLGLQHLQQGLLSRAVNLTRPGGTVVYSTCTYAPEENEAVVARVLEKSNGVFLDDASMPGLASSPGLEEWDKEEYGCEMRRCARYYSHQNDTGGFFVAKLVKT